MTDNDLKRLEDLASAATPGPWTVDVHEGGYGMSYAQVPEALECACSDGDELSVHNAVFIAAAREAVPALCAEVRKMRLVQAERNLLGSENHALARQRDALKAEVETLRADLLIEEPEEKP